MVEFIHIVIDGEYIYADEHEMKTDTWSMVKLHVSRREYYYSGKMTNSMVMALWRLQDILRMRMLQPREVIYLN